MRKLYLVFSGLLIFAACSKPDTPAPDPPPRPADTSGRPASSPPYVVPTDSTGWHLIGFNALPFFTDIHFVDTLHGYANAGQGIYSTSDGGLTWNQVPGVQSYREFSSFFFLNSQQGYSIGRTDVAVTMDGGHTWKVKPNNLNLTSGGWMTAQFFSPSTGYLVSNLGHLSDD
ncbi:WD40/YVTN/BNR-like repeat-containing protein [Puia sp. P3]|uniref:WD40/YVTN/BNR-like repeat-containing protein n=1 Tax=Puia sp. P3 TaxID=3423952 RepID=UPI003D6791EB